MDTLTPLERAYVSAVVRRSPSICTELGMSPERASEIARSIRIKLWLAPGEPLDLLPR